jgi:capsular exopolysaccharide synthesis family protein
LLPLCATGRRTTRIRVVNDKLIQPSVEDCFKRTNLKLSASINSHVQIAYAVARSGALELVMTELLDFEMRAGRQGVLGLVETETETIADPRRAPAEDSLPSPLLGVIRAPTGGAAEAIRSIRAALMAVGFARGGSFALVAARAGQGTSVLAANLALAFAQLEFTTLLVDANLRRPGLAALFRLSGRGEGLAEHLMRRDVVPAPAGQVGQQVAPHLALLPAGAPPPNPHDLIASRVFARLSAHWAKTFDVVIYDAPAALECADAALIAARARSAVIAARLDHGRYDDVRQTSALLRAHGCAIAGVVAADFA